VVLNQIEVGGVEENYPPLPLIIYTYRFVLFLLLLSPLPFFLLPLI
jgi:hypothetical protein